MSVIVFGGGCFWCTEAVFQRIDGVTSVQPGYAGGTTPSPTYESHGDHAEVVRVEYTGDILPELLRIFFGTHDATQLNRQGNDVGPQNRSTVLYSTEEQKEIIQDFIASLDYEVTTIVAPLDIFTLAEDYHQKFYERNKAYPYCMFVIRPKLKKLEKLMK